MHKVLLLYSLLAHVCLLPAADKKLLRSASECNLSAADKYLIRNVEAFTQYVQQQNTILVNNTNKLHALGVAIPAQNKQLMDLSTKVSEQNDELRRLRARTGVCGNITQLIIGSVAAHYGIQMFAWVKSCYWEYT